MNCIEAKVGVSHDSNEFFHCFHAIALSCLSGIDKKMEVYKSFRFTNTGLSTLFKNQPYYFALLKDIVRNKLSFIINGLGYTRLLI